MIFIKMGMDLYNDITINIILRFYSSKKKGIT